MKKLFCTLALFISCIIGYAQEPFTQATFSALLEEYKKDSKAFFINRLSDDFRYTNVQGKYQNRNDIIKADPQKILSTEIFEPVIFQSCDLAVISGIHKTVRDD